MGMALAACGGKVIIDDGGRSSGGHASSGGEAGRGGADPESSAAGPEPTDCELHCKPSDGANCACAKDCDGAIRRISCILTDTLTEKNVIQCVCSYDDVFSGACYEKNNAACDFEHGCCAKYFSGM